MNGEPFPASCQPGEFTFVAPKDKQYERSRASASR